jgi:hypothetical protein
MNFEEMILVIKEVSSDICKSTGFLDTDIEFCSDTLIVDGTNVAANFDSLSKKLKIYVNDFPLDLIGGVISHEIGHSIFSQVFEQGVEDAVSSVADSSIMDLVYNNETKFRELGGCTEYSNRFWKKQDLPIERAINETFAEICNLKYQGDHSTPKKTLAEMGVKPFWIKFYETFQKKYEEIKNIQTTR